MKTIGIICEYNPFHLGHARHIELSRAAAGGDCAVICAMSGNITQRGELAVFNKHARAEAAVRCGADLVLELPAAVTLASAEHFAHGAVQLLNALGVCDEMSFGSECGDLARLERVAETLTSDECDELTRSALATGLPYAESRQRALNALSPDASLLRSPNNLLAVHYVIALRALNSAITPRTVRREGDISASAVRELLRRNDPSALEYVPAAARPVFDRELAAGRAAIHSHAEVAILSRLRVSSPEAFAQLPDGGDGLAERLARFAPTAATLDELTERVKTKRHAMSRVKRAILCAAIGITAEDAATPPPTARVLAMNGTGRALLREIAHKSELPIVTKPSAAKEHLRLESAATDLFVFGYAEAKDRAGGVEWTTSPVVVPDV
ncbi:MAG: nucleotidyltransferase family protein [Oscillospiraceae bacterium]|jgi:predicted nucleotidyltransferase|nr:nucleotidyltransferase family protein [Oscillospiraceae bacterium]